MRNLPSIVSKLPNDLKQFLERVREKIDGGEFLTREDLIRSGLAQQGPGGSLRPSDGAEDGTPITPPAPINVTATGAMTSIFVEFDYPQYRGHAYAEIWRAETNNLGQAQLVGQTPGKFYADAVGGSAVRWYWVRLVSTTNTAGPYNGTGGTRGETTSDPSYLLDQLAGSITESQLYADLNSRIDLIDGPTTLNNSVAQRIANEATARAQAIAAEASTRAHEIVTEQIARASAVSSEAAARNAAIAAEADARLALALELSGLADSLDDATALIINESATREAGDAAEAAQRNLLAAQMRGGYSGNDLSQVTSGLLYQERIARATQDSALAQQITLLSAGAGEQFDWKAIWYFDNGLEDWTGNGTPTVTGGWLRPANQASGAYVVSPAGIGATGTEYSQVKLRVRKTGAPTFAGFVWWKRVGDTTWDVSRRVSLAAPVYDANGIALITISPAWSGTIDQVRIDLSSAQNATDYFEVDWFAVGRPSPGASTALFVAEQLTRAQADAAEVTARETLSARITGATDPSGLTLGTLTSGLLYDERQARVTQDTAIASSVTSLQAAVTSNYNTLNSAITTEQTARANADSAEVSARQALSTKMTGLADPASATLGTLTSGLIFDERQARSTADSAIASELSVLSSTVTTNHSTAIGAVTAEANTRASEDAALASQITAVLSSVNGVSASVTEEANTRATADEALSNQIATLSSSVSVNTAAIQTESQTRATAIAAMSSQISSVIAVSGANTAAITAESSTRASEDAALSTRIDTVVADVGDAFALIQDETTARVSSDNALAQQISTLGTEVDDNFATLTTNYYTKSQTDSAISSASQTLVSGYQSADAAALAQANQYTATFAYAKSDTYTKSQTDSAISSASQTLVSGYQSADAAALAQANQYTATFAYAKTETYTKSEADSAISSAIETLSSSLDGNIATIQSSAQTINGLSAQYTFKIDNNGFVSGYGLSSDLIDGGSAISRFYVNVNEFAITTPTSSIPLWASSTAYTIGRQVRRADVSGKILICKQTGVSGATTPSVSGAIGSMVSDGSVLWQVASAVPFAVLTTTQTINGATLTPGTYIDGALIRNGTLNSAQIGTLAAEKISVGNLAADRIKANVIEAVNLSAQYIHADRIDTPTLTAKLAAIETAYIDEANITNGAISNAKIGEFIQSNNYSADSAGWRIDKTGFAEFQNVKVRGDVEATSLNAATGTFTGQLNAATGTFGGQLLAGVLDLALAAGSSYIYDQPGTYSFTVPEGMTSIRITCVGAGGGGGSGGSGDDDGLIGGSGAGGGGAGQANQGVYNNITPGTVLTIVVGSGGAGGVGFYGFEAAGLPGSAGASSYVTGYLSASGGAGGGAGPGGDDDYIPPLGGAGGYLGGQTGTPGGYTQTIVTPWYGGEPYITYNPLAGSGGAGGASGYGLSGSGGAGGNTTTQPGTSGVRGSGGGGGAGGLPGRPGGSGGAGGNGLVIVEAYNPNAVVLQTTFKTFTNNHFNALCTHVGRGDLVFAG